jgi:hypothetical protein
VALGKGFTMFTASGRVAFVVSDVTRDVHFENDRIAAVVANGEKRGGVLIGTPRVISKPLLGCGGGSQGPIATPCSNRKTAPQGAVLVFLAAERVRAIR